MEGAPWGNTNAGVHRRGRMCRSLRQQSGRWKFTRHFRCILSNAAEVKQHESEENH